jgi:predicted ATP-binding protein involved in virulence
MNGSGDTRKLERIEEALLKLTEDTAYLRGRMEDIHVRTAEIPIMVEDQSRMKRSIRAIMLGLAITVLFHVKEVWAWAETLIK